MNFRLARLCLTAILLAALGGCHTVEGFGKDMEKVGEQIQESIRERKQD